MAAVTPDDIARAARLIAGQVLRTPTLPAPRLSGLTGADIVIKYENMQVTGAFKERGALVRMAALSADERRRGVIAMSAGNHAQGVAWHAARMGIPATIIMPAGTPNVKVDNTRALGATVLLVGETLTEAEAECRARASREGLTLIHPYDDPLVIAGQGTIALEMLADAPDLEVLVVPVGGGGLISGIAIAAHAIRPDLDIIGVEAELYPAFRNALTGETRPVGGVTLAEGIAVRNVGATTLPIIREHVSDIILVKESQLEQAVNIFATHQHALAEGAGAAGLAAVLANPEQFRGRKTGLILCGGNIDARILAAIMMRELERAERIVSFRLTVSDRPGLLGHVATLIGNAGANILEVSHRRLLLDVPAKGVSLDITMETRDRAHADAILAALAREDMHPRRIGATIVDA